MCQALYSLSDLWPQLSDLWRKASLTRYFLSYALIPETETRGTVLLLPFEEAGKPSLVFTLLLLRKS